MVIWRMKSEGLSKSEISRRTSFTYNTVQVYLSDSFLPINGHYGKHWEGKLYNLCNNVLTMRAKGKTYAQIYEAIRVEGYKGASQSRNYRG